MLVDKQNEVMSNLLFTVHQHGGDDVTWKPPIVRVHSTLRLHLPMATEKPSGGHLHRGYYTVARRYEFYFRVAKQYCFCHSKIKFISSSSRVMFFLLYRQKDIDKVIEGNDRNYVIDKLKCEIMENKWLGSRMQVFWILRVVYFPVKHSSLYNKRG